jgi:hypothetical protein
MSAAALLALTMAMGLTAQAQEAPSKVQEPVQPVVARPAAQLMNVKLELTITDSRGAAAATSKTVTMVLADRASGRIRTTGEVRMADRSRLPIILNVDAQPEITRDNRVKVSVTLEYKPQASESETEERATTSLGESMTVILEDGKPLVVSQSADPYGDRKVRIEMKATFLK